MEFISRGIVEMEQAFTLPGLACQSDSEPQTGNPAH